MLRLLFWRLEFELLELLSVLGFRFGSSSHFAYGADLDAQVLARRNIALERSEPFELKDFELVFDSPGENHGVGYASIHPQPGARVLGLLTQISRLDALRLNAFEGATFIRHYKRVYKSHHDRKFYFYSSVRGQSGLKPRQEYLEKILGFYRHVLPPDSPLLLRLEGQPTCADPRPVQSPRFLFANYDLLGTGIGTLLRRYDELCLRLFFALGERPGLVRIFKRRVRV